MRKVLIVLLLLIAEFGYSQANTDTTKFFKSFDYGWNWRRAKFREALILPTDTTFNKLGIANVNGALYLGNGSAWSLVSGSGGGAVSSVFGRTGIVTAQEADYSAFYPLLSGSYNNPSWINQLAWSKIIGAPAFLISESQSLNDVTTVGNFTNNAIRNGGTGFQVRNGANTQTLGEWFNNGDNNSELYIYNLSTSRQSLLTENKLEFKNPSFNYQALKPHPTPTSSYRNFYLPNTAADRYLPTTFKINSTTVAANDTGLVDLGTVSPDSAVFATVYSVDTAKANLRSEISSGGGVSIDSGGIASRPVSPSFGQRYYQTNELAGWYYWNGRFWEFMKPYDMIVDFTFPVKAYNTPTGITLDASAGGDWRSVTGLGIDGTTLFQVGTFGFYTAAATAKAGFKSGPSSSLQNFRMGNDSNYTYHTRIGTTLISDATNAYTLYAGWNANSGASDGNGAYFKYTHSNNSGQWQCIVKDAGGTTTINTSVTFAVLTAYDLVINRIADDKIEFFINGTLVGQSTTNMDINIGVTNGSRLYDMGAWIQRSAGTGAVYMIADRLKFYRW